METFQRSLDYRNSNHFAAFMFVLDETIANVALPHMAGTFSVSRQESTWILTSYIVASGIMITAVDWFCKLMGRKISSS